MSVRVRGWAAVHKLVMLASFAASSALNYAFAIAAGWLLGPGAFGLLAFAQSVILICGLVLETGVPWSLTRDIASADPAHHAAAVRGALVTNLLLAGGLALAVCTLYVLGPFRTGLEGPAVLALVCAALSGIAISAVCRGAAQGVERFWVVAVIQVIEVVVKTAAGLGLTLSGYGVTGALMGFVFGAVCAAAVGLYLVRGMLRTRAIEPFRMPALGSAVPMFGALLAFALLLNVDLLAVKVASPSDRALAGYYQAAMMLANLPCFLVTSAVVPLVFARLVRAGGLEHTGRIVGRAVGLVLVTVLPIELVLVVAANVVVSLVFPDSYAHAADLLRPLALSRSMLVFVALLSAAFQASGRAALSAATLLTVAVLEAGVLIGTGGSAAGLATAYAALLATSLALVVLGGLYLRAVPLRLQRLPVPGWPQPTASRSA